MRRYRPAWLPWLAFGLSVLLFLGLAAGVFRTVYQCALFDSVALMTKSEREKLSFTDLNSFSSELSLDLTVLASRTGTYLSQSFAEYASERLKSEKEEFVRQYKEQRADAIRSYLFECLCRDDVYDAYVDYFKVDDSVYVPSITIEKRVLVDPYAPEYVQKLQKILNGTDGTGFLRYVSIIPEDVFGDYIFEYTTALQWYSRMFSHPFSYTLEAEDAGALFDAEWQKLIENIDLSTLSGGQALPASLHYYIDDPGTDKVYTDEEYASYKQWREQYGAADIGFTLKNGQLTHKGLDTAAERGVLTDSFAPALTVEVFIDTSTAPETDKYYQQESAFLDLQDEDFELQAIWMVLLAAGALGTLIWLLVLCCGKRMWIDRISIGIHLLLFGATAFVLLYAATRIFSQLLGYAVGDYEWLSLYFVLYMFAAALGWSAVCEMCTSVVRILKSGELAESMLICVLPQKLWRWVAKLFRSLGNTFGYRPGTMRKYLIPAVLIWGLTDIVLIGLIWRTRNILIMMIFMAMQFLMAYKICQYLGDLDRIILSAYTRKPYAEDTAHLARSLQALVQSQTYSREELAAAIERAVRDERTKTELITNVSHDLKTPLTSIINYVDLLSRCEIGDEKATEYLAVLADKSGRLKRLIEDLVEASKVSTGNVTLEKTELSLSELVNQAIVEESDGLERVGLELIFRKDADPTVYSDGPKLYRVLENLLSNVRKYSLPGTRVYAALYEQDGYAYFELKNTSKEPLDIPPEELSERFVRGDKARGEEGSGLGLSIARDLCALCGGSLILAIDGDLFKATVRLPVM